MRLAGGAGALVLAVAAGATATAWWRARTHYTVPPHTLVVPSDSASIARGAHVAQVRFCTDCHAEGLRGSVMVDEPMIGRLAPPNLTAGRPTPLTTEAWELAVRHGVRPDGTPLQLMPSHEFTTLTDEDLGALVAWARQLPAVDSMPAPTKAGPLFRALDVAGVVDLYPAALIDHAAPHAARITAAPTVEYGRYLATSCSGCHGPRFSGGPIPGAPPELPPAANLTPSGIGHYTRADFARLLRTGKRPDGTQVNDFMPWRFTAALDETEIDALYAFLRQVEARSYGQR